jgi:hypothetical protein
MKYTDEMLMAYADGELDPGERAGIEAAMRADPAVAQAVARHRALREDVFAAFAGVLDEPVPERLRTAAGPRVFQLDEARERRAKAAEARRWSWPQWGAMAATLVLGILIGSFGPGLLHGSGGPAFATGANGELAASGRLDEALTRQLAGAAVGDVRVGLSFASKSGSYCRSFVMGATAGLACREQGRWQIPVLAPSAAQDTAYREAATELPQAVLDAVDERISGTSLDAAAERRARDRGWEAAR